MDMPYWAKNHVFSGMQSIVRLVAWRTLGLARTQGTERNGKFPTNNEITNTRLTPEGSTSNFRLWVDPILRFTIIWNDTGVIYDFVGFIHWIINDMIRG